MDERLKDPRLHPDLVLRVSKVQQAMAILGHPMRVVSGYRTTEEQQKLYAQGRTVTGRKVTNVDGVRTKSQHQKGRAVDLTFLDELGRISWAEHHPWDTYGACARAAGLKWGGDWKSFKDRPHVELPATVRGDDH